MGGQSIVTLVMLNEVKQPNGITKTESFWSRAWLLWRGWDSSFHSELRLRRRFVFMISILPLPKLALWAKTASNEDVADSPGHRIPD